MHVIDSTQENKGGATKLFNTTGILTNNLKCTQKTELKMNLTMENK